MATSHFPQTAATPRAAEAHETEAKTTRPKSERLRDSVRTVLQISQRSFISAKLGDAHRVYNPKPSRMLESPFNQEYLDRLCLHDAETAKHFYGYFTKLLLVQLRFRLRSQSLAEDAAQETLMRVLVAVRNGEIQSPERLPGFVRAVSDNVAREITRKNVRFQQIPENNPEPIARIVSAELNCISEQSKQRVLTALKELSEKDQALVNDVYILERDKETICQELGIDRGSLRVRQFRALARLRKAMGLDGEEPPQLRKAAAG